MKLFDKKKNRKNSNSKKWDRYQSRDILPMWVADMDFESPACIKNALRKYVDNGIFGYHSEPKELRDILKLYLKNKGWNIKKEWIVLTPSVKAIIPFLANNPNSVMLVPSIFCVRDAQGNIFILDLSLPLLFKKSTIETLSIIGFVFGMVTTDVTPPDNAALLRVLKFSLYS